MFDTLDQGPAQMLGDLLGPNPPRDLATAMHGAWIRFVRDGDPGWPAYEPPRRETMRFDETSVVVEDPHAWQRRLWGEAASGD